MESREDDRLGAKDAKKAYTPPKLVRLGSVRDLTFGTSQGTKSDGSFSKIADK